jgi:mycofactocin system glycosyltransferase
VADVRYRLDASVRRRGDIVIGGSPLRLFRLTPRGARLLDHLSAGEDLGASPLVDRLLDAGAIHPDPVPGPAAPRPDDVTVVVPVRGAPPVPPPPGSIVVDDASDPPVDGATVRLDVRGGPGRARDAGLERVRTPFVAFVDADVTLPGGWLDALLPHFADPRVALVAPRIVTPAGSSLRSRYEARNSPLDLGPEPARIRAGTRVSYVPTAAVVCRVAAIREVGGFDHGLTHGEDVDLVWRLDEAGWRCRYEPSVEVEHPARATWTAWIRQRIDYGASAAPLSRRHAGALAPVRTSGWSALSWALASAGRPVLGAATGLGTALALVRKLPDVPARDAFGLAATGNAFAGRSLASAVRRVWWPIVIVAALRSRTARRLLAASALAAGHPIRILDDAAYGVGVWRGMWRERTLAPLVPELSSWPGRAGGR